MGRRAYITTLALGRSPFEPPDRTDSGEFILGPHAHDFEDPDGYVQQFNERGHPENKASRAAARELRRAKNDVLSTVGVVVNKNEQLKNSWRKKTEKEKVDALIQENDYGVALAAMDMSLMFASLWWIVSLRARVQTFRSFSTIPLLEVVRSELRLLEPLTFFTSGMLAWVGCGLIEFCRNYLVESSVEWFVKLFIKRPTDKVRRRRFDASIGFVSRILSTGLLMFSTPIQAFYSLQSLHLMPLRQKPSLLSLIPFSNESPVQLPHLPAVITAKSISDFASKVLTSPFFVGWIYDYLQNNIEWRFYQIIRRTMIRPNNPDELSERAAREDHMDEASIPGLASRARPPSLFEEIEHEFGLLHMWFRRRILWIRLRTFSRLPADDHIQASLSLRSNALMHQYAQEAAPHGPMTNIRRQEIRRAAIRRAFSEFNLPPPDNIDTWNGGYQPHSYAMSTPTPEPEELFDLEELVRQPEWSPTEEVNRPSNTRDDTPPSQTAGQRRESSPSVNLSRANTLVTPLNQSPATTPPTSPHVRASLSRQDSNTVMMQLELHEHTRHELNDMEREDAYDILPSVEGDVVGDEDVTIHRALEDGPAPAPSFDLEAVGTASHSGWRPVTIDGDDDLQDPNDGWAIEPPPPPLTRARTLEDNPLDAGWSHPRDSWSSDRAPSVHRVTALSNRPSDAFASHASSLLAGALLLPLESLYLRSLALAFLTSPAMRPGSAAAASGIRSDVWEVGAWFGGSAGGWSGKLRYASVMLLTLGLQGAISTVVWGFGAGVTVSIGRRFGWGQL